MTTNSEDIEEKLPAEETAETLEAAEAEAPAQAGEPAQAAPEEVEEDISAALEKELLETKDRLLRTMAEYDNHRKRTVR